MRLTLPRVLAALLAAVVLFGVFIYINDGGDGHPGRQLTNRGFRTIADPPGPAAPVVADRDNEMEVDEQAEAARSAPDLKGNLDLHEDTRDETPPGVSKAELAKGKEKTEALAEAVLVEPQKPAGAQAYSCPPAYVRNQSALNGPRVGSALHFTVSSPGSLLVVRGLFNAPSFGASSNKGIELTGRCQTWVPSGRKAWAQGAANSAYESIEIVTRDLTRAQWLAAPIIKNGTLAAIVRDQNLSVGAPLKHVDPKGCVWTPGIVDHDALECGNSHWDVGKNFPWDVFMRQVQRGVEVSSVDRVTCRKLNAYRRDRRRGVRTSAHRGHVNANRRKALERRGVTCLPSGPVRR